MKIILIAFAFIISILNLICKNNKNRSFIIDNTTRAVGDISDDTTYNGLISFYDINSNTLLTDCEYVNGIKSGINNIYYTNGKVKSILNYENNKLNGYVAFFDSTGKLYCKQYYYYGLKVGPNIAYKNEKEYSFNFNSFDHESLLYFEYDSLKYKKLTQLQERFFHYRLTGDSVDSFQIILPTFFIYLLNAPKFKFEYSLVKVDSIYNDQNVYYTFNSNNVWKSINIEDVLNKDNITIKDNIAIKLFVYDSVRNEKYTMYKKIKW